LTRPSTDDQFTPSGGCNRIRRGQPGLFSKLPHEHPIGLWQDQIAITPLASKLTRDALRPFDMSATDEEHRISGAASDDTLLAARPP